MQIIAIDTTRQALEQLMQGIRALYPDSQIEGFLDPLLAVKHGVMHPPDTLYTAVRMRRMNGFEVVRMLRVDNPRLVINFVADNDSDREDGMRLGMNSYTLRPVTKEKLRAAERETW